MIAPADYRNLLEALARGECRVILVGGVAAVLHGSARFTADVDVIYDRSEDNLRRIVKAVAPLDPYPRDAPPGLPFLWDEETLRRGLNFTLTTRLGPLDLFGEVPGGGTWQTLHHKSQRFRIDDFELLVVGLRDLIALKRAAGRPKDYESISELEALLDDSSRS